MQHSLQYYCNRASSGVAQVMSNSSARARTKPVVLRNGPRKRPGVDLEKHPNRQQRIINVLITKCCSNITPKSHDNYLVHPNGATFEILNIFSAALIQKFTVLAASTQNITLPIQIGSQNAILKFQRLCTCNVWMSGMHKLY